MCLHQPSAPSTSRSIFVGHSLRIRQVVVFKHQNCSGSAGSSLSINSACDTQTINGWTVAYTDSSYGLTVHQRLWSPHPLLLFFAVIQSFKPCSFCVPCLRFPCEAYKLSRYLRPFFFLEDQVMDKAGHHAAVKTPRCDRQ